MDFLMVVLPTDYLSRSDIMTDVAQLVFPLVSCPRREKGTPLSKEIVEASGDGGNHAYGIKSLVAADRINETIESYQTGCVFCRAPQFGIGADGYHRA